jgi:transposase-like protein
MATNYPMTPCPKCRSEMIFVTAVPHPKAPEMRQATFVCYPCNRTWNYALSPEMVAAFNETVTAAEESP